MIRIRTLYCLSSALLIAGSLTFFAATPTAAQEAISWIVSEDSSLSFTFTQSKAEVNGEFESFESDILFAPDALEQSRVEVRVDLSSIETGSSDRDQTAKGDSFFDVEDHPTAVFTADSFTEIGENQYEAEGILEIRGMEKPLTLPFTLEISGDEGNREARAEGEVEINRLDYSLGEGDFEDESFISHAVSVHFVILANEADAQAE